MQPPLPPGKSRCLHLSHAFLSTKSTLHTTKLLYTSYNSSGSTSTSTNFLKDPPLRFCFFWASCSCSCLLSHPFSCTHQTHFTTQPKYYSQGSFVEITNQRFSLKYQTFRQLAAAFTSDEGSSKLLKRLVFQRKSLVGDFHKRTLSDATQPDKLLQQSTTGSPVYLHRTFNSCA